MLRKVFFFLLSAGTTTGIFAQDTTAAAEESCGKSLNISGSLDVYYRYDFGKTRGNNLTSFTGSHNSFELGMASVKIDKSFGKVSMVADIGFGKRAADFSYNDDGAMAAIKQLYVSYAPADWIKFTMGSWATHVGYELVDPMPNKNYSMSYMFSYGPFFHTGLKAEVTRGKHGFMLGVSNPTDYKFVPDGGLNKKFLIAQYSYVPGDKFAAYLNFVSGQNPDTTKGSQVDLVMTTALSDKFSLGFNGTVNSYKNYSDGKFAESASWWGSALYINYDASPKVGLTLRNEYLSDAKGRLFFGNFTDGGGIFATTLTANLKVADCFKIVPELRIDNASENIFTKSSGAGTKSAVGGLVAAVFVF